MTLEEDIQKDVQASAASAAKPLALVPGRSDKDVAEELKKEIAAALTQVCGVMDKASAAGFRVGFRVAAAGIPARFVIAELELLKAY